MREPLNVEQRQSDSTLFIFIDNRINYFTRDDRESSHTISAKDGCKTNKTMKQWKWMLLIALSVCTSSCKKLYYQVSTTKATDPAQFTETRDRYVYEDENCRIVYNMWMENGSRGFVMTNKTDRNMYIDLEKSCILTNGKAYSTKSDEGTRSLDIIPPHKSRRFSPFQITDSVTLAVGLKQRVKHAESISFTKDNSLLTFGNFITYCFDNHENETTILHEFYVDRITNIPYKEMIEYRPSTFISNGKEYSTKSKFYKMSPKTGFFVKYIK